MPRSVAICRRIMLIRSKQIAAFCRIDKLDQTVTDFEFHRVDIEQLLDLFRLFFDRFADLFLFCDLLLLGIITSDSERKPRTTGTQHQSRHLGHAGHAHECQEPGNDHERLGLGKQLAEHLVTQILLAAVARDNQTSSNGNNECRDLAYKPVTDGQLGIYLQALEDAHVLLGHADIKPPEHVHHRDDDARDSVTADEFAGTVHGSVEVGFVRNSFAAGTGLGFGDVPGIEVCVDRHLLPGHSIQGEIALPLQRYALHLW